MKTQLILLRDCSHHLDDAIEHGGPFLCACTPAREVYLQKPPAIVPKAGRVPLPPETTAVVRRSMALACQYDNNGAPGNVRNELQQLAIALQLVKPTRLFLKLCVQLDESNEPEFAHASVRDLGFLMGPEPYLRYQQHNVIEKADLEQALRLLPNLAKALDRSQGSWEHPIVSIHRSFIFFCQRYTIKPADPMQFLWVAGLDCLFASKLKRIKQGSKEISARMINLLGATMRPYDAVSLPVNQYERGKFPVAHIAPDIFKLRNAFAHGSLYQTATGWERLALRMRLGMPISCWSKRKSYCG
ncbi:MAG: hypothetical protein ACRD19_11265 [Terriglobia bacterium]